MKAPHQPFPREAGARRLLEEIRAELPRLGLSPGGRRKTDWSAKLSAMDDEALLGKRPADDDMARAVRSGLLLRADLLDASHTISQSIKTPTGSYWHGIMHRREGDFRNSKYWFNRVGEHPIYPELGRKAEELGGEETRGVHEGNAWDPYLFVDLCESASRGGGDDRLTEELETLQELEIDTLLEFSYRKAVGR